jgi:hypothetical protein
VPSHDRAAPTQRQRMLVRQSVAVHYPVGFPCGVTPISTLDELPALSPKRRVLRIGKTVARVFGYCRADAWPLFIAAWFPCLLATLCLVALGVVLFAGPGQAPAWLLSNGFDPRTWLSAIVVAPFSAMVFAFVLDRMANAPERGRIVVRHGVESIKRIAIPGPRFEVSRRVFLAALPLAALSLCCSFLIAGEIKLLVAALLAAYDHVPGAADLAPWTTAIGAVNALLRGFSLALAYVVAGDFLWTGSFDPAGCWRALGGNRLRFLAILFIVFAIVAALQYAFMLAAGLLLIPADGAAPSFLWSLVVHFALKLPFDLLYLVLSAATVGTVLGAFRPRGAIR